MQRSVACLHNVLRMFPNRFFTNEYSQCFDSSVSSACIEMAWVHLQTGLSTGTRVEQNGVNEIRRCLVAMLEEPSRENSVFPEREWSIRVQVRDELPRRMILGTAQKSACC